MTNQELNEIKSALIKEGKKVSSFPLAGSLTGNEKVPIIQGGKNVVVPASEFMKGNSSSVEGNDNIIILPLEFTSSNDEEETITREEYNIIESAINSDKILYIKCGNSYVIPSNYAKIENYITFMYYEGINERYNYNVYQITITEQDENTLLCSHSYVNRTVQKELKSGENVKTINGQSILGNGNINVNESGEVTIIENNFYFVEKEIHTGTTLTQEEYNDIYNAYNSGKIIFINGNRAYVKIDTEDTLIFDYITFYEGGYLHYNGYISTTCQLNELGTFTFPSFNGSAERYLNAQGNYTEIPKNIYILDVNNISPSYALLQKLKQYLEDPNKIVVVKKEKRVFNVIDYQNMLDTLTPSINIDAEYTTVSVTGKRVSTERIEIIIEPDDYTITTSSNSVNGVIPYFLDIDIANNNSFGNKELQDLYPIIEDAYKYKIPVSVKGAGGRILYSTSIQQILNDNDTLNYNISFVDNYNNKIYKVFFNFYEIDVYTATVTESSNIYSIPESLASTNEYAPLDELIWEKLKGKGNTPQLISLKRNNDFISCCQMSYYVEAPYTHFKYVFLDVINNSTYTLDTRFALSSPNNVEYILTETTK